MTPEQIVRVLMVLRGGAQYTKQMLANAQSHIKYGQAVQTSSGKLKVLTRHTFAFNQVMFTLRRVIFYATLGVAAMGVSLGLLGLRFNVMKEQALVSFRFLLGSVEAARKEVKYLFDLAAVTPFEFENIQRAARQFLGWGFAVKDVNRYMGQLADVISVMGTDTGIIDRVIYAFGQIRSTGRLVGQDLRQIQQAVPGVSAALVKAFGLPAGGLNNIARYNIPADQAIEAIMTALGTKFKGAAVIMQRTVQGQITTLRDYASMLFGQLTMTPFLLIREDLPKINKALKELTGIMEEKGFDAFLKKLDKMIGANGTLLRSWATFSMIMIGFGSVMKNIVLPALGIAAFLLSIIGLVLWPVGWALKFVGDHFGFLKYILGVTMAAFIGFHTVTIGYMITTRILIPLLKSLVFWERTRYIWVNRVALAQRFAAFTALLYAAATGKVFTSTTGMLMGFGRARGPLGRTARLVYAVRNAVISLTVALKALTWASFISGTKRATVAIALFLATNPVGWAILLAGALTVLYLKWERFNKAVNDTPDKMFGSLSFDELIRVVSSVPIKAFATGGTMFSSGMALVGERGPEIVKLPGGAQVTPLTNIAGGIIKIFPQSIFLDGKKIGEVMSTAVTDREARQ